MNATAKTIEMVPTTTGDAPATPTSVVIMPETAREVTPLALLDRAMALGLPVETLRDLMALKREHEADQARKAFSAAFAAFKAEAVKVVRKKAVTDGPLKGKRYAELIDFVEAAVPMLSKHGLSHSWAITKEEKDWIEVTCTIEHVLGGTKTAKFGGPPDTGGAKNVLQARISTVTYLERATFKAACGLAEQGDDDDGKGGAGAPATIPEDTVKDLQLKIVRSGTDLKKFLARFVVERLDELTPAQAQRAHVLLDAKLAADTKPEAEAKP
jgi:hypothetical protein